MGYAHPDHLLEQITSEQLSEWEAYNRMEPIGEYRRDYRIAALSSLVYNFASSFGGKGKRKIAQIKDFMFFLEDEPPKEPEQQSVEEMKAALYSIAATSKKKGPKGKK